MPTSQQTELLQEFADEIFDLSKDIWAAQTRSRGSRDQAELSETEFLALDVLEKSERTLSVGEIQRQIGVLPAQMSRIIRSLETKGGQALITCKINPEDKRKIDVELTPAGRKAHHAYRQLKLASIQNMLGTLNEADRQEFMRLVRQIRASVRKSAGDK